MRPQGLKVKTEVLIGVANRGSGCLFGCFRVTRPKDLKSQGSERRGYLGNQGLGNSLWLRPGEGAVESC